MSRSNVELREEEIEAKITEFQQWIKAQPCMPQNLGKQSCWLSENIWSSEPRPIKSWIKWWFELTVWELEWDDEKTTFFN